MVENSTTRELYGKLSPVAKAANLSENQASHIIDFSYKHDPDSKGRLVVFCAGIASNEAKRKDFMVETQKAKFKGLDFDSITTSFVDHNRRITIDDIVSEYIDALKKAREEFGITNVIFFGTSLGAGFAVRIAQHLHANPQDNLKVDALLLAMPCINEDSVKGVADETIKILRGVSDSAALAMVKAGYKIRGIFSYFLKDKDDPVGSTRSRLASLRTIPEKSLSPIDKNTRVFAYFSENDRYIQNENVKDDLNAISSKGKVEPGFVSGSSPNKHNLGDRRFTDITEKFLLPNIKEVWGDQAYDSGPGAASRTPNS